MLRWIKKAREDVSDETKAAAIKLFNEYAETQKYISLPVAHISFEEELDAKKFNVEIDVQYNGVDYHMRSLKPEDHENVYRFLNSQPAVREKFADKQTVSPLATKLRVKTLSDRFKADFDDGCAMQGGFYVTDADTNDFLGMTDSGFSGDLGYPQIAFLFRPETWSHRPSIVEGGSVASPPTLSREYKGIGTATVCTLLQYEKILKDKGTLINGSEIEGVHATAMIENPGSWKAMAKAGMTAYDVDANEKWGPELRYKLGIKL
ncbi:MAG: GNAT family N-acetyltransferase [Pseudomonadota bacterium]